LYFLNGRFTSTKGDKNDYLMSKKPQDIKHYVTDFLNRLDSLNEQNISFVGYSRDYLLYLLKYKAHYVSIYQYIIEIVLKNTGVEIANAVFVDFGAGNGLLAMLARLLPFHRVLAIDVDEEFVEAARQTSGILSIDEIEFINGGEEVLTNLKNEDKTVIVAGTDVIEHIYDLTTFFNKLTQISTLSVTVFTTASNPENKRIVNRLMQLQRKEERIGGTSDDRALFGYTHKPFLELRKDIIIELRPSLDQNTLTQLVKVSRGLRKDDIQKMVEAYEKDGVFPTEMSHPTNTCHPVTGSWSERLVELNEYEDYYNLNGFALEIMNGFYDSGKGSYVRRLFVRVLNLLIKLIPVQTRRIAPFILLVGTRKT
jgi:predicted RNA methylase